MNLPDCRCGHPFSLHNHRGCRRIECILKPYDERCAYYLPAERIPPESLAALAYMIADHLTSAISHELKDQDARAELRFAVLSLVPQLVPQWAGYRAPEGP